MDFPSMYGEGMWEYLVIISYEQKTCTHDVEGESMRWPDRIRQRSQRGLMFRR